MWRDPAFRSLLKELSRWKKHLSIAGIFSVISSFLQIVPYFAIYFLVSTIFIENSIQTEMLWRFAIIVFGALIGSLVCMYIGLMASHIAAFHILYEMRMRLVEHLAFIPYRYFIEHTTGEIKKVIEVSVEKIETFIAHQIPDLISAVVVPFFLFSFFLWMDWKLTLFLFFPVGIAIYLQYSLMQKEEAQEAYIQFQRAVSEMNSSGIDYVRGIPTFQLFGVPVQQFTSFFQAVKQYQKIAVHITSIFKNRYSLFMVIVSSLFIFIVPIGVILVSQNTNSISLAVTFILFLIASPALSAPFMKLLFLSGELREVVEGNRTIQEILQQPIQEGNSKEIPNSTIIEAKNVNFSYVHGKEKLPVLRNLSFQIPEQSFVAIVGPSGSGKSTIGQLLARFWDVSEGAFTLGGVPIRELSPSVLYNYISFVFQDVYLFADTVFSNIAMDDQEATLEKVVFAAEKAQCHEFISQFKEGYNTKIGEHGTKLSGGEAQRIALARAFYQDHPIVFLDEITAYADAWNEKLIEQAIQTLAKEKTVIMVAHRLSTVKNADHILVMKEGEIVEQGTHDRLLQNKKLYAEMWEAYQMAKNWRMKEGHLNETLPS